MSEHIFVTGTSGAIGGALARALRRHEPRARLTLVDVAPEPSRALASELGGEIHVAACDLSKSDQAMAALEEARGRFGPVHGLVNCAGFMEVRRFERLPWARAEALLAVDLVSPLRLMHAAVPDMLAARRGFVVNVASMAGRVTLHGCAFYCAAKAGLAMASEVARRELAPAGISVVTVYPGAVQSELESRAREQYGRKLLARIIPTGKPEVLADKVVDALAMKRARVVYPASYSVGLLSVASPIALAFGPTAQD
ncbi:SDR family NAD(P)-dependent oxidoreductase [Pendulispora albinea]|uniref:SDR family NAD(P)-dependent oxidoreductase n=1 Tax=Pendulispora albinea TaxID=2741071 RepID=A0ABZ2LS38_9BACT